MCLGGPSRPPWHSKASQSGPRVAQREPERLQSQPKDRKRAPKGTQRRPTNHKIMYVQTEDSQTPAPLPTAAG